MVAAGLSVPPTGPPVGYSPPLLVGRFWFSDLVDWVSSQSVQLFRHCLLSSMTKMQRDRQNSLRGTWIGRFSKPRSNSRNPAKSLRIRCPLHSRSCASLAGISRRLFYQNNVSQAVTTRAERSNGDTPSLVMKEMNSLTHSCMHSFASLAIFAFSGKAVFIMRATGAKLRMLASDIE